MSNETAELIANYSKEAGLSEEQMDLADSEILYTLFGLQTLAVAINNISRLSNKSVEELSKLKSSLENNIFNKHKELGSIKEDVFVIAPENKEGALKQLDQKVTDNQNVATLVPEVPPANLPMIEKGEVAHDVPRIQPTTNPPSPEATEGQDDQPFDLAQGKQPTTEKLKPSVPVPDYKYPNGKDPYREPMN
ncbi:MAG: hypothetical protein Q8P21_01840 [bacterium]|nr:hypothetical protein [bacterium]